MAWCLSESDLNAAGIMVTAMRGVKQSLPTKNTPRAVQTWSVKEILRTQSSVIWKPYSYFNLFKSLSPVKGHACCPD